MEHEKKVLHMPKEKCIIEGMKTTRKAHHIAFRMEDDILLALDGLCDAVGGASRSRLLRRLLLWLESDPSDTYRNYDGSPVERNVRRREFVAWFRRLDDAIVADMVKGIDAGLRQR